MTIIILMFSKKVVSGISVIISTSETLFLVKPSSLFITLVYSLTSITAEQFGEIVNNGLSEKL